MRTFNHVGIITNENQEGAMFNEGLNVWLTNSGRQLFAGSSNFRNSILLGLLL